MKTIEKGNSIVQGTYFTVVKLHPRRSCYLGIWILRTGKKKSYSLWEDQCLRSQKTHIVNNHLHRSSSNSSAVQLQTNEESPFLSKFGNFLLSNQSNFRESPEIIFVNVHKKKADQISLVVQVYYFVASASMVKIDHRQEIKIFFSSWGKTRSFSQCSS